MPEDLVIPVDVVTGFLGSGKTTLIKQLLAAPELGTAAVLVNEFGEVALDHIILERVDEDITVLAGGCVCCGIREDLSKAVRNLLSQRERGSVPQFDRLIIETTGLAYPAPVLQTLAGEPIIRHHFRLGRVVTTVDILNSPTNGTPRIEWLRQVAAADRIVLTKGDLATEARIAAVVRRLYEINPAVETIQAHLRPIDANQLFDIGSSDYGVDVHDVTGWPEMEGDQQEREKKKPVVSFAIEIEDAVDWIKFGLWLSMLVHAHGERLLRIKGLLNIEGVSGPVIVHGVQHVIHSPVHLGKWPDDNDRTRIVFIVEEMSPKLVCDSLVRFLGVRSRLRMLNS